MESLYKKKSLKFSGYSKEIKKQELLSERKISGHQRLSVLRSITEESKENETNIPKIDLKTTKIPSRAEMLKKWREEKLLKQQRQQQMKKPPLRVGVAPKVITPSIPIFDKVSNQSFGSKSKTSNVSKVSTTLSKAISNERTVKNKVPQISKPTSITSKISQISKYETVSQKSVSSTVKSSQLKNTHSMKIASLKPIQKESASTSSKTTAPVKKSVPQEPTPKPVSNCIRNNAKNSQPFKPLSFKPAFSKSVKSKETISNCKKTGQNLKDKSGSTTENLLDNQTSQKICHVEPRKSFAPENFKFSAPIKLDISVFDIDGPSSIFFKGKIERERTSTPLKETNQNSKQVKSSKAPSLKEVNDSLSTPLKETDLSLNITLKETDKIPSTPVNNRYHSTRSSTLKEANQNFKQDSVEKINEIVCQKQTLLNVDIKELNILDKLTSDKESVLEALNDKNSANIHASSIDINSFENGILEKVQKQSKNDSLESDKLIAEHRDEPLDTFFIVPEGSLKEKGLNLPETRQSMKPTGALQTKSKLSLKPNLESVRENSEDEPHLETPKSSKRSTKEINFTPRRSARLAEKFRRSGSFESLLNVGRPSIMESIDLDESDSASAATGLTYDFDYLHLEDTPIVKTKHKVSLLYTPVTRGRPSTRKSIKGDLISFSPSD